ncbi:MAG: VWA domain-containing protein [Campylobacterota bacterium]|nr:VWA domain-containing protein [Campylobacterota bacterium]
MNIIYPHFLWLIIPLLYIIFNKKLNLKNISLFLSLIFIILALLRVVIKEQPIQTVQPFSDVVLAVDLSASMKADDITPSRVKKANEIILHVIEKSHNVRFAILGFSANGIILSPLTSDKQILSELFSRLDEDILIAKSTHIMSALKLAQRVKKETNLIIFSDGGDESDFVKEIEFAKKHNMVVSTVMLATPFGSTLKDYKGDVLKDDSSNIVISRANSSIKELSLKSGGKYITSNYEDEVLELLNSINSKAQPITIEQNIELFPLFIALAILFALIAFTTLNKKFIALVTLLFSINSNAFLLDDYYTKEAFKSYKNREFIGCAKSFSKIESQKASYNSAICYYEAGLYDEALSGFKALHVKSSDIFYNIALCYFKLDDIKSARENFVKSLSLKYDVQAVENIILLDKIQNRPTLEVQSKKAQKSSKTTKEQSQKSKKSGGSSNMSVQNSSNGDGGNGKKKEVKKSLLQLQKSNAPLSSKQYELINERGYDESNPW